MGSKLEAQKLEEPETIEKVASTVIEDANIVSFLMLKGFVAIPFLRNPNNPNESSRVAWDVQGEVEAEIRNYYQNELVGIHDFVKVLKEVRSQMYNVKQISNQYK